MNFESSKIIQYTSPNLSVDDFESINYHPAYKTRNGKVSTWLRIRYADSTFFEMEYYAISDYQSDAITTKRYIKQSFFGPGGRIYPGQMNAATTPRLAAAKKMILEIIAADEVDQLEDISEIVLRYRSPTIACLPKISRTPSNKIETPTPIPSGQQIGERIGKLANTQNGGKIAKIIQKVTALNLTQRAAVTVTKAAINAIGLNAAIIDAGAYQIAAMVQPGISKRILIIDGEGGVFDRLADLTIEERSINRKEPMLKKI